MLRVYDVLGIEYLLFKLEKKMLRIAIFRNVSRDFFFLFLYDHFDNASKNGKSLQLNGS